MDLSFYTIFIATLLFVSIDAVFLFSMSKLFMKQIQDIQGSPFQMNIFAAVVTYFFLITGLYYFILRVNAPPKDAFLFGIVVYAVYEFTSMSLFKKWSFQNACIDTLWGGILFYLTTIALYWLKDNNYLDK
jgi:uncharacterized membrane protein